jgi:hypothetical protein
MGIFKENPVCKLCIKEEEEETSFHIAFECEFWLIGSLISWGS